jgi:hypothetical protein
LHALLASGELTRPILDSTAEAPEPKPLRTPPADVVERHNLAVEVAHIFEQWLLTDDLQGTERPHHRLVALIAGLGSAMYVAHDGFDADEIEFAEEAFEVAAAFCADAGADPSDLPAIFGENEDAAERSSERLFDLLTAKLPEPGSEAFSALADAFAAQWAKGVERISLDSAYRPISMPVARVSDFVQRGIQRALPGDRERMTAAAMDAAALDAATYRREQAIRHGKRTVVRERVAGILRLSVAQKVAIRKARMRAHSATARARRLRSLKLAKAAGLQ